MAQLKYITAQDSVWYLSGDLIVDCAHAVLKESQACVVKGTALTIDFEAVTDIDTSVLALVLAWTRRAKTEFYEIQFKNVPTDLKSLAALYGIEEIIQLH